MFASGASPEATRRRTVSTSLCSTASGLRDILVFTIMRGQTENTKVIWGGKKRNKSLNILANQSLLSGLVDATSGRHLADTFIQC